MPGAAEEARRQAVLAARDSYGRLLAVLAAAGGDLPAAEDALADAFERALRRWPDSGVPDHPDAWLLTVARNRLRDHWKSAAVRTSAPLDPEREVRAALDDIDPEAIGDRRLELLLVCAHPGIDPRARTPLMLNVVLGFTAARIAGAWAVPPSTMAARLVRAKHRVTAARIPFELPDRTHLPQRLDHVLEAVYGAYAIDWSIAGRQQRPGFPTEAQHLAETLARLAPDTPETHGLAALISLSEARRAARFEPPSRLEQSSRLDSADRADTADRPDSADRVDPAGRSEGARFVPLDEQDTTLWDRRLIARGREHLRAAHRLGMPGRFALEAAVQAVHCARLETGSTDWAALLRLHRSLQRLHPTLGGAVALAVTLAEVEGPEAGLAQLEALGASAHRFQPACAARAHLLDRQGRTAEAVAAYDAAIALTTDPPARAYLEQRRAAAAAAIERKFP